MIDSYALYGYYYDMYTFYLLVYGVHDLYGSRGLYDAYGVVRFVFFAWFTCLT